MHSLIFWPAHPALSILALWLVSAVLLWAAREPLIDLLKRLGGGIDEGLTAAARWCATSAEQLRERSRQALLAAGSLDLQRKLDREFHRIDRDFAQQLGQYAKVHRRMDDLLRDLDADYKQCGDSPPEVPGWSAAASAIAQIPATTDPNVHKVLDGIRKSSQEGEKKALAAYREATSKRHGLLGRMAGTWQEVRGLMARMQDAISRALECTGRIDGYMEEYLAIRDEREEAARALSYSAVKLFVISIVVLGVALGGAFVNFQLISLPMSELVPAGARIGGIPVPTISALVIVLMEAAVGIFVMDMLGVTELFPKLAGIPTSRRRLILGLGIAALLFLASVESSLAVLREQIAAADVALKLALSGEGSRIVATASSSKIPVVGQAVLGFVLPWVLALVAVPLEMLLDSGRHVLASIGVLLLHVLGSLSRIAGRALQHVTNVLVSLVDVYVAVPVRIERWARSRNEWEGEDETVPVATPRRAEPKDGEPVRRGESLA
jgi:hypothetical protein